MEPMPNESRPIPAYDDTEPRLTKLEKAMTDQQCDYALFKQRTDSGFAVTQAQLALTEEKLRREFHDGMHALEQHLAAKIEVESQRLETKVSGEMHILAARLDRQDAKIDQLAKWLIGAQLTTMAFVAGIAIQLFLR